VAPPRPAPGLGAGMAMGQAMAGALQNATTRNPASRPSRRRPPRPARAPQRAPQVRRAHRGGVRRYEGQAHRRVNCHRTPSRLRPTSARRLQRGRPCVPDPLRHWPRGDRKGKSCRHQHNVRVAYQRSRA
jgi:hypothetical protein